MFECHTRKVYLTNVSYSFIGLPAYTNPYITLLYPPIVDAFPPHVMRYYSGGNLFAGLFGNSQIVSVAMAQVGNQGGEKFWSWYGFNGRVEWCAYFVSWCADQCGLITNGAVPKFASCPSGVEWFRSNGKWKAHCFFPIMMIVNRFLLHSIDRI